MVTSRKLMTVGCVLVLAGLGMGFWPLNSGVRIVGCGSAFVPVGADSAAVQRGPEVDELCGELRGRVWLGAIGLLIVGGLPGAVGVGRRFASQRAKRGQA